jgi:transposase
LTHLTDREHMFAMLRKESQVEIDVLHRQGKGIRAIARATGLARNTVRAVLRGETDDRYGPRRQQPSKIGPYEEFLRGRLEQAGRIRLPATVLHRELVARGYSGGVRAVQRFLEKVRPPIEPQPVHRFETPPGRQLQIDFVDFRRAPLPLRAFTAELGFSRYPFVEFTDNERADTLITCLEHALLYFGGVPQQLLCDNPKTIVIKRDAYGDGLHRFNGKLLDFAKHYGLEIKLCLPYRAQTKGKVERFHRYLRESFFNPLQTLHRDPVDVPTANREVRIWLQGVASCRVHATLQERPIDRFAIERESLAPLPLPYGGHRLPTTDAGLIVPTPVESLQHPLSLYESFAKEIAA